MKVVIPQLFSRSVQTNSVFQLTTTLRKFKKSNSSYNINARTTTIAICMSTIQGAAEVCKTILQPELQLSLDVMSERPGEFDYKLEDDVYCHRAAANSLASSGRKDQAQSTKIVLGPLADTINQATQPACLHGHNFDLRYGEVVMQDRWKDASQGCHANYANSVSVATRDGGERVTRSVVTADAAGQEESSLQNSNAKCHSTRNDWCSRQRTGSIKRTCTLGVHSSNVEQNSTTAALQAVQQVETFTQMLIKLYAQKGEDLFTIVEQEADVMGLRSYGDWYYQESLISTLVDRVELSLDPRNAQNDGHESKCNRRNDTKHS